MVEKIIKFLLLYTVLITTIVKMLMLKFTFIYNLKNPQCSEGAKLEARLSEGLLYFRALFYKFL